MAKVIASRDGLGIKQRYRKLFNKLSYVVCVVCSVLCIEFACREMDLWLTVLMGVLSFFGTYTIQFTKDRIGQIQGGIEGEEAVLKCVKKLPDTYYCITNPVIQIEGRDNELDLVVVGPNGVHIIEVKNWSGTVNGSYLDDVLHRKSRKGEETTARNPIRQVGRHTDTLSMYLSARGINPRVVRSMVFGAVFFYNKRASVNITDIPPNGVRVFSVPNDGWNQLMQHLNREIAFPLTKNEIEKIVEALQ